MRDYEIETPDGKTIVVEGPEDATDDELIAFAQAELKRRRPNQRYSRPVVERPSVRSAAAAEAGELNLDPKRRAVQEILASQERTGGAPGFRDVVTNAALLGLPDEIDGAVAAVGNVLSSPFTGNLNPSQAYYDQRDADRGRLAQARENAPLQSIFGDVLGGFATGGNAVKLAGAAPNALRSAWTMARQGAKEGAVLGGIAGFGSGDGAEGSALGGVLGGGFGGVLGSAIPLIANAGYRTFNGVRRFMGAEPDLARRVVGDALGADANSGRAAGEMMDGASALGVPYMLADTGENARSLAASVSRQPGPSRRIVRDAVTDRQIQQSDRVRGFVERDLGPITSTPAQAEALREEARVAAQEAVTRAGDNLSETVGSVGPVMDRAASGSAARETFEGAYGAARQRTREAYNAPELQNPQPIEIGTEFFARDLRKAADDFYGDGGGEMPAAIQSILSDAAAPAATTRTLTNIDRRLADVAGEARMGGRNAEAAFAERLRGNLNAFADEAAPADYRAALASAKQVRAEQGRVFETRDLPRAFARDRYGNPVVGDTTVPTRLMRPGAPGGDTADSLVEAVGPAEAENLVRQELRRVIEDAGDLTPARLRTIAARYDEAMGRFPGVRSDLDQVLSRADALDAAQTQAGQAGRIGSTPVERGAAAVNMSADEIERIVAGLPDDARPLFAQGFRNGMVDALERKGDDADKARALLGSPRKRQAIASLFGGTDELARFETTLGLERNANDTYRSVMTGSQTAERRAADTETDDGGLVENTMGSLIRGGQNGWTGVFAEFLSRARSTQYGAGEAGKQVRQDIATLLTETDPARLRQILDEANRAAEAQALRGTRFNGGARVAGASLAQGLVTTAAGTSVRRDE